MGKIINFKLKHPHWWRGPKETKSDIEIHPDGDLTRIYITSPEINNYDHYLMFFVKREELDRLTDQLLEYRKSQEFRGEREFIIES